MIRAKDGLRAEGIRVDVADPPNWMKEIIEKRWVECGIIEANWVNQYAMNVYHDGSEGIKQHFDDIKRFDRPIYSVRLYSPSRLCFGSLGFAMSNSVFYIPMPRGCVTVLGPGFASDHIKHCVRACDMNGKSCALLLRRVYPKLIDEATLLMKEQDIQTQQPTQAQALPSPVAVLPTPRPITQQIPAPPTPKPITQQIPASIVPPVKEIQGPTRIIIPSTTVFQRVSPELLSQVKIVPATTPIHFFPNSNTIQIIPKANLNSIPITKSTTISANFPPGYLPTQFSNITLSGLKALNSNMVPILPANSVSKSMNPPNAPVTSPVKVTSTPATTFISSTQPTVLPVKATPITTPAQTPIEPEVQSENKPQDKQPDPIPTPSQVAPKATPSTPVEQAVNSTPLSSIPQVPTPSISENILSPQPPATQTTPTKDITLTTSMETLKVPIKTPIQFPTKNAANTAKVPVKVAPAKRVPLAPIPKQMISKELQARLAAEKLKKEMQATKKSKKSNKESISPKITSKPQTENSSESAVQKAPETPKPAPVIPLDTTPNLAKVLQRLQRTSKYEEGNTSQSESLKRSPESPQTTPEGSPQIENQFPNKRQKIINIEENKENCVNQTMDSQ